MEQHADAPRALEPDATDPGADSFAAHAAEVAALRGDLARARAEAARWERAYRRLRGRAPVRAMAAARRTGVAIARRVRPVDAGSASTRLGVPAAPVAPTPVAQPPVAPTPVAPTPVAQPPLAPPPPAVPPAPPEAVAPSIPLPLKGTAPFSVPYRAPAGHRTGSVARLDPAISNRRFQAFDTALGLVPVGRLVDLGAGHGLFSRRAADAGWDVTAVDARTERFPQDDRVTWVHQDVREHDLAGYDLIVCLGLFYHLTLADQHDLLERAGGTPILMDTHVDVGIDYGDDRLGEHVEEGGYRGRLYGEHLESPLASWVNETSFWPDLDSFYRLLADHGYAVTLALEPWYGVDRTFFLLLPGTVAGTPSQDDPA
ncbi:MAG TPA: class I SAM-dependent methyltransferase [Actinomycetales bacterium]|jgi:hypothetical protein